MGPRADWTCLSKKCQQDGAATVYYDLPINTTRCPVCGSKRITRLYNAVNVARGIATGVDRMVQPVADEHDRIRSAARAGEARGIADGSGQRRASFMQPISAITGQGAAPGKALPAPGLPVYVADNGDTMRPAMKPTTYAAIDRESKP
jgi:hypothetical protein